MWTIGEKRLQLDQRLCQVEHEGGFAMFATDILIAVFVIDPQFAIARRTQDIQSLRKRGRADRHFRKRFIIGNLNRGGFSQFFIEQLSAISTTNDVGRDFFSA